MRPVRAVKPYLSRSLPEPWGFGGRISFQVYPSEVIWVVGCNISHPRIKAGSSTMQISVKTDIQSVTGAMSARAKKQLPFARSRALTITATTARKDVQAAMPAEFDRPTPWAVNSIRYGMTKIGEGTVSVFISDDPNKSGVSPKSVLYPHLDASARKLKPFERALQRVGMPTGSMAVPGSAAPIDRYGNIPAGFIVQLLAYLQAFGEQGYKANADAKGRARIGKKIGKAAAGSAVSFFVSRGPGLWFGRKQTLHAGIWQRTQFAHGSSLKPVILFVKPGQYRRRFDFQGIVEQTVKATFVSNFQRTYKEAMASAR